MNDVQVFNHPMFGELPTLVVEGTEWFGATDAASALSFSDPHKAINNHVDEDDSTIHPVIDSLGRKQNKKFINESGLYNLIFGAAKQSNNPEIKSKAKKYKGWVTSEVLPSIRKHGAYMTESTIERMVNDPDFLIKLGETLKAEQEARRALEQKIQLDQPKVLFADSLQASSDCILIANLAKILKQNGVNTGQNRLYQWMRENGYLGKRGEHWNMPTQRAMDLKLFEVKTTVMNRPDKDPRTTKTTVVTGRGQMYFLDKLKTGA
ncbi:phage antirepressor KilAC domain-containing protein [Paenibacillus amylolyticus]|uniref:phage antirepressor KilAC domain-containing protein n=1 Tax=Paenibacillus amylolyticus TaxID=1451 RepID=UPI003D97A4BA